MLFSVLTSVFYKFVIFLLSIYLISLRDTKFGVFVPQGGLLESAKPFKDDPAKQDRFEQFLKDKYEGGLRTTQPSGITSENDRAIERLDFEAAAEAIEKGRWKSSMDSPSTSKELEFISSAGLSVRTFIYHRMLFISLSY